MPLPLRYTGFKTMGIVARIILMGSKTLGYGMLVSALAACSGASGSNSPPVPEVGDKTEVSVELNDPNLTIKVGDGSVAEDAPSLGGNKKTHSLMSSSPSSSPVLTATSVPTIVPRIAPTPVPIAATTSVQQLNPSITRIFDTNLEVALKEALGMEHKTDLTKGDLESVNRLDATSRGIFVLNGIENCINLTELYLSGNPINDISSLSSLTRLKTLHLAGAHINDITPIATLTELRELNLYRNDIRDISALESLTQLTDRLSLGVNQISDLSPLSSLINLSKLDLNDNKIKDISALEFLTGLVELNLAGCTPIRCERGGQNDDKTLGIHQISDISVLKSLTNLESLILQGNEITDISHLEPLTNLTRLHLSYNQISDISSLEHLYKLTQLYLNNNLIADISPLVSNTGMVGDSKEGATVAGPRVALDHNSLDLSNESQTLKDFRILRDRGVLVTVGGTKLTP